MNYTPKVVKENLPIMPFRGSELGIIRLSDLAKADSVKVWVGGIYFKPVGFDTYGHPIMSKKTFLYYQALKSIAERKGGSLLAVVEYESAAFCIKKCIYDSALAIETAIKADLTFEINEEGKQIPREDVENSIMNFKSLLVNRKKAHFIGKELHQFVVFNKYVLDRDGHIYLLDEMTLKPENQRIPPMVDKKLYEAQKEFMNSIFRGSKPTKIRRWDIGEDVEKIQEDKCEYVISENEIQSLLYSKKNEIHIPGPDDRCGICGQKFLISDVINYKITHNAEAEKIHITCAEDFKTAINNQIASQIVDAVYDGKPNQELKVDIEDGEEKIRYLFHTAQGDISIRIKRKVIEIIWYENFKPFNLEELFEKEIVTKYSSGKKRVIHAWSPEDAKRYLLIAKKA